MNYNNNNRLFLASWFNGKAIYKAPFICEIFQLLDASKSEWLSCFYCSKSNFLLSVPSEKRLCLELSFDQRKLTALLLGTGTVELPVLLMVTYTVRTISYLGYSYAQRSPGWPSVQLITWAIVPNFCCFHCDCLAQRQERPESSP